jgi:hypothetical protein
MPRKELKFIHIPKNAGTTIEDNAKQHCVLWGKYDTVLNYYCRKVKADASWHTPLRFIDKHVLKDLLNRYDFFAVVRNPYDRCLSEFHYFLSLGRVADKVINKDVLNKTVCKFINQKRDRDHWCPQSNYIYDSDGNCIVKNVIFFEDLERQFNWLMGKYQLSIKLETKSNVSKTYFTIHDLYPTTISLINEFYYYDFINFGYKML